MTRPLIILTNDDGIDSPGLAASASAVDPLGDLLIVAPLSQQSGTGRSMPHHHTGTIAETTISANGQTWKAYAADASPAQCVQHAILELTDRRPSLAISGVNFGENVGTGITISGTVGAALEAAALGVKAMAVSLQVDMSLHINFDHSVDFSTAEHFTRLFAERWLAADAPDDVDVLKIDIPIGAGPDTPWRATRLERNKYYVPVAPPRKRLDEKAQIGYKIAEPLESSGNHTDVGALLEGVVSVTPISLDMTSRVGLDGLQSLLGW